MIGELFQVLEFVTSVLVIITLYLISRSYKWWLAYAVNSVLFSAVSLYFGRYWFGLMGACLCVTAVRNYIIAKKKEKYYDALGEFESIDSIS